ncbi:YuzL family protein, partial [Bacillus sp. JJ1521]|uniref:YuzL family protein n=1 Tax=Bacillus sp. JJ1521 TaxID=3122957 RepID=UPI003F68A028
LGTNTPGAFDLTEVMILPKRKKDPTTIGLGSPNVEGQGTTNQETGRMELDSSRKKKKKN